MTSSIRRRSYRSGRARRSDPALRHGTAARPKVTRGRARSRSSGRCGTKWPARTARGTERNSSGSTRVCRWTPPGMRHADKPNALKWATPAVRSHLFPPPASCSARVIPSSRFLDPRSARPHRLGARARHRRVRARRRHHHRRDPAAHAPRRHAHRHRDESGLRQLPAQAYPDRRGCASCRARPRTCEQSCSSSASRRRATSSPAFRSAPCRRRSASASCGTRKPRSSRAAHSSSISSPRACSRTCGGFSARWSVAFSC